MRFRISGMGLQVVALFIVLVGAGAQEPGTPHVLIEPKFMKAPVSAPIADAERTEFVAAMKSESDVTYLGRAQFDAMKMDWSTFAIKARTSAEAELKAISVDYVRARKKVILYAKLRSSRGLMASAVLAPAFLELFKETLGDKVLVVIPNRSTAYVFPALASRYQDYAPMIFEAYRATAFPVSTEVFEMSAAGMKAVGAFEEP